MPVRCFSCNGVVGHLVSEYCKQKTTNREQWLTDQHVRRICCRRMFISHVHTSMYDMSKLGQSDTVLDDHETTLFAEVRHSRQFSCD